MVPYAKMGSNDSKHSFLPFLSLSSADPQTADTAGVTLAHQPQTADTPGVTLTHQPNK